MKTLQFSHPNDIEQFIWAQDNSQLKEDWDDFADDLFAQNVIKFWDELNYMDRMHAIEVGLNLFERYAIQY